MPIFNDQTIETYCYTCNLQITDKSIKCYICGNIFHTKTGCTKIRINDLKNVISNNDSFACHQCLESCFPFNNLNNPDFLQTIENSTSEIDMNRINNGITTGKHNVEFLFIEILNHNSPNVIVGIIYRLPNSKYDEFDKPLREILSKVDRENKPCYLMGDFNISLRPVYEFVCVSFTTGNLNCFRVK